MMKKRTAEALRTQRIRVWESFCVSPILEELLLRNEYFCRKWRYLSG